MDRLGLATHDMNGMALRPLLAVVSSVLSFALLIERAGLMLAVVVSVLVACGGSKDTTVREALLLSVCLAGAVSLLFVGMLGQPFRLIAWP